MLAQYAHAAGVTLAFDAAQLGGARSGGLQGSYGVDAGFAKALEGTGWRAVFWGFASAKDAEKVRLALADKGLKTDVVEF